MDSTPNLKSLHCQIKGCTHFRLPLKPWCSHHHDTLTGAQQAMYGRTLLVTSTLELEILPQWETVAKFLIAYIELTEVMKEM